MSNANDDKSPLIDLITCIVCKVTMKIANSAPDTERQRPGPISLRIVQ